MLIKCIQDISWIPVHTAATAIVDFCHSEYSLINLVHPRPAKWSTISSSFASVLNIPVIPHSEWLARLDQSAEDAGGASDVDNLRRNPGLRLLDWYHSAFAHDNDGPCTDAMGFPKFDLTNALAASRALADDGLPRLDIGDVKLWVYYWKSVGFLPA